MPKLQLRCAITVGATTAQTKTVMTTPLRIESPHVDGVRFKGDLLHARRTTLAPAGSGPVAMCRSTG